MSAMGVELKGCPFCGETPTLQKWNAPPQMECNYRYFCDWGVDHAIFIGGITKEDAAEKWNRRAALASPTSPPAQPPSEKERERLGDELARLFAGVSIHDKTERLHDQFEACVHKAIAVLRQADAPVGEPTNEMCFAGMHAWQCTLGTPLTRYAAVFKAMLAATPRPAGSAE